MEWRYPKDQQDVLKYHVYRSLWRRGYFLTSGEKFGGDYLAYPGDPMRYHSHYIVSVRGADSSFTAMDLVTMGRLATNTKKTFVLATHRQEDSRSSSCSSSTSGSNLGTDTGSVDCFSIAWAGF
jgi:tRNA-splicing endonuclease subunit Sen34